MSNNINIILITNNKEKDTLIEIKVKRKLKPLPKKYKSALELIAISL